MQVNLIIIAFNDLDEEEMLYVADSLSDLLLYNNGIEVPRFTLAT